MKKRIIILILMLSLILTPAFVSQALAADYENEAQMMAHLMNPETPPTDGVQDDSYHRLPVPPAVHSVRIDGVAVVFDGQLPTIVDGRTLVPVRGVFEHVGFDVDWDPISRQVTLTSENYEVILTIGSAEFTTNGIVHTLDVPAQIIGDRTMLPIRAVLESVGYHVSWDDRNRIVLVSSTPITYVTIRGEQLSTSMTVLALEDVTNAELVLVAELVNLRILAIGGAQVTDITPLANLTSLTELRIGNAPQIIDFTPISGLANLTQLTIADTQISNLTAISSLNNLTELRLWNNQISDLRPLGGLTNLSSLNLNDNQISDLSPLTSLTNLRVLDLYNNPITDWSPVAHIEWVSGRP